MGLFDFFKGKNKEEEFENNIVEEVEITEEITEDAEKEHNETSVLNENANDESDIENNIGNEIEEIKETEEDTIAEESNIELNKSGEESFNISLNETEDFEESQSENSDEKKKGFFAKLLDGLSKTRNNIMDGVDSVLGAFTSIDDDLFEELEEVLIMADIGVETTLYIIENLKKRVKKQRTTNPIEIKGMLIDEISEILNDDEKDKDIETPTVMLVIGVNGVGKTTTIGKLASSFKGQGKQVLLAAADTFRAAAIDQLEIWGKRSNIEVIKHEENSDPAAVIFDAVNAAKNRKTDILICDTAGRLHNKKNLMEELKKIDKVVLREYPSANKEVYLVLDATTGQNAMQQAKLFKEAADITGIILTKLDGTAKGGIVIAIKNELKIPVKYIGVGEGIDDLQKFDSNSFSKALFNS